MIDIIFHDETGMGSAFPAQADGFEKADGSGEIHYYRLFDGVGIMLLRLEMETYTEIRTQIGMIEINFCINGRFETSFSMRDSVLLKPGDMAISCYDGVHGSVYCCRELQKSKVRLAMRLTNRNSSPAISFSSTPCAGLSRMWASISATIGFCMPPAPAQRFVSRT